MKVRFLLDENISPRLITALKRLNSQIDIVRVGDKTAPSFGTSDSEILLFLVDPQRFMVTDNRSTMPGHLNNHYATEGDSHRGILWVRPNSTISQLASDLYLIWIASEAEEWFDHTDWIPF